MKLTRSRSTSALEGALRREAEAARTPASPASIARVQALLREAPHPGAAPRPTRSFRPVAVLALAAAVVLVLLPLLARRAGAPEPVADTVAAVTPEPVPGRSGLLPRLAFPVPRTALDDPLRREMQSLLQDTTGMARTLLGALPRGPRGS